MHVYLVFRQQQFTFNYAAIRLLFHVVLAIAEPIIVPWEEFLYSRLVLRWAGLVARRGGRAEVYIVFWWGDLKERGHLEDQVVDGRIILTL